MRWITLVLVTCLLLAGIVSCTGTDNSQEMYQYYMQIAQQYEVAAATEETQAEYYANLAQALKAELAGFEEQSYEEMMSLAEGHQANANKYWEAAEQYKAIARQYR